MCASPKIKPQQFRGFIKLVHQTVYFWVVPLSCACTIWSRAEDVLVAVQLALPLAAFWLRTAPATPQTVAATLTGACTVTGIWLTSTLIFLAILFATL